MKYVDEGRLSLNTAKVGNHCLSCGTKIAFGKFCDRCRVKMEGQKMTETAQEEDKNRVRMHISDKKK